MRTIDVYKELGINNITQGKTWKKIKESIQGINEEILLDLSNNIVKEPWNIDEFMELLRDKRLKFKFKNDSSTVEQLKIKCILCEIDYEDRFFNEDTKIVEEDKYSAKIKTYGERLLSTIKVINGVKGELRLDSLYEQIQSIGTVDYIKYALDEKSRIDGITNFTLYFGEAYISGSVANYLVIMQQEYLKKGIRVTFDSDNKDAIRFIALYGIKYRTDRLSVEDRKNILDKLVPLRTVGILTKYVNSKGKDEFGRYGNGESLFRSIAVLDSVEKSGTTYMVRMHVYKENKFYTGYQWMIEHDYEEMGKPEYSIEDIDIRELGVYDETLGSRYQFVEPVVFDKKSYRWVVCGEDENGKNIKKLCSLPERIKEVFDSWGIKYNKDKLENCIKEINRRNK